MTRLVLGLTLILLPVAELAVLIKTGQVIGVWATVALVIGMGFVGLLVLSRQSFTVLRKTLESMSEGRPPVEPVLDGLFLMLAGGLLVMPGLLSDAVALVLLVPPIRRAIARWSIRRILASPNVRITINEGFEESRRPPGGGPTIEGEFRRVDENAPRLEPGGGRPQG